MGRLDNKVAIVSGGSSGIGRATCLTLAREGARVVVADINTDGGNKTVDAIDGTAIFINLDVIEESQWQETTTFALAEYGRLDVLVNCAGVGVAGIFEDTSLEDWNYIIGVNLTGVFLGCKHSVQAMKKSANTNGSIINISSIAGLVGGGDIAVYSASKGGVTMLTKSVALSCAERNLNIRCNSIHPTYVDSEMLDEVAASYPSRDAMRAAMSENIPLGRMAVPQDIANAILFLASDESSMMTGSSVAVDGGTTAGTTSKHATES